MYEFVRGPLVWIAFLGFFGGLAYRLFVMARLARKADRIFLAADVVLDGNGQPACNVTVTTAATATLGVM